MPKLKRRLFSSISAGRKSRNLTSEEMKLASSGQHPKITHEPIDGGYTGVRKLKTVFGSPRLVNEEWDSAGRKYRYSKTVGKAGARKTALHTFKHTTRGKSTKSTRKFPHE